MSTRSSTRHQQAVGKKFGRLTVESVAPRGHVPFATCRCECGKVMSVRVYALYYGHTKSCGCLHIEKATARVKRHGQSKTPTYRNWRAMRARCEDRNNQDYARYGGRGIKVCERWRSFSAFLEDMGERPPGLEIDRIDNNGNYEPDNCRWATRKEQNRNSSHNHNLTFGGKTQSVSAWAEELSVSRKVIYGRLRRGEPLAGRAKHVD